jgi:hypothetical protein
MNPELFSRLVEEAGEAPDWRSSCAGPGRLPVFHLWGPVMYLTPAGDTVIDHEEDGPLRPADPAERDFALARAADQYPELAHLRPPRPQVAVVCDLCDGRGSVTVTQRRMLPWRDGSVPFLYCPGCNSLGWTVAG